MQKKDGRRSFLKKIGISGLAVAASPVLSATENRQINVASHNSDLAAKAEQGNRAYNSTYSGQYLNRVAFPIGGMGAGMYCLEGTGAISHMSVKNRPEVFNEPSMFAAIAIKGKANGAKVLEGQVPEWKDANLFVCDNIINNSYKNCNL